MVENKKSHKHHGPHRQHNQYSSPQPGHFHLTQPALTPSNQGPVLPSSQPLSFYSPAVGIPPQGEIMRQSMFASPPRAMQSSVYLPNYNHPAGLIPQQGISLIGNRPGSYKQLAPQRQPAQLPPGVVFGRNVQGPVVNQLPAGSIINQPPVPVQSIINQQQLGLQHIVGHSQILPQGQRIVSARQNVHSNVAPMKIVGQPALISAGQQIPSPQRTVFVHQQQPITTQVLPNVIGHSQFIQGPVHFDQPHFMGGSRVISRPIIEHKSQDPMHFLIQEDAVLTLLELIKRNPPGLKERLQRFSKQDGRPNEMSEREFFDFCNDLNIQPPHFVMLLRDVAGFRSGFESLDHRQIIQNFKERIRPRKEWEKDLFKRINRTMAERNITAENLYQRMMTQDGSEEISHQDLKFGMESLGIPLGSYDLNYVFYVLDHNRNGLVSLKELRDTLVFYEGDHNRHHQDDLSDFGSDLDDHRHIQKNDSSQGGKSGGRNLSEFEMGPEIAILGNVSRAAIDAESAFKTSSDFTVLNGHIKIQIPTIKGFIDEEKLKRVVLRIRVKGASQSEVVQNAELLGGGSTRFVALVPVRNVLLENLSSFINIQLYSSSELNRKYYLGEIVADWKSALNVPDRWAVAHKFLISNPQPVPGEEKRNFGGVVDLLAKWIPGAAGEKTEAPRKFVSPVTEKGRLQITVLSAILPKTLNDIKCLIRLPNDNEVTDEATYDSKQNPIFSKEVKKDLSVTANVSKALK